LVQLAVWGWLADGTAEWCCLAGNCLYLGLLRSLWLLHGLLSAARPVTVTVSANVAVVAAERHESRRIDNQLRGRSGRQGDPGSTRFFLSLEDSLFRYGTGTSTAQHSTAQHPMPLLAVVKLSGRVGERGGLVHSGALFMCSRMARS
jgi:hypothetical protein